MSTSSVRVLHRARAKFALMQRLGIDTMLVCSNVGTATVDDDEVSAGAAAPARRRGSGTRRPTGLRSARVGPYVDDYRRAWRIVELADHDAVGVCLDSFHILSRGHDPVRDRGDPRGRRSSTSSSPKTD